MVLVTFGFATLVAWNENSNSHHTSGVLQVFWYRVAILFDSLMLQCFIFQSIIKQPSLYIRILANNSRGFDDTEIPFLNISTDQITETLQAAINENYVKLNTIIAD